MFGITFRRRAGHLKSRPSLFMVAERKIFGSSRRFRFISATISSKTAFIRYALRIDVPAFVYISVEGCAYHVYFPDKNKNLVNTVTQQRLSP